MDYGLCLFGVFCFVSEWFSYRFFGCGTRDQTGVTPFSAPIPSGHRGHEQVNLESKGGRKY